MASPPLHGMEFLILKDGEIALERWACGWPARTGAGRATRPRSRYLRRSSATALHDGAIGGLDDRCETCTCWRLRGSPGAGVPVRNVMRMCSGVPWNDVDDGQNRRVAALRRAQESRRPGSILDLARTLPRAQPQGVAFNYSTVDSYVLGAVVVVATGQPLADYCAEKIWGPAGMEANRAWEGLESEGGLAGRGRRQRAPARRRPLRPVRAGGGGAAQRLTGPARLAGAIWSGQPDSAPTAFASRLMLGSPSGIRLPGGRRFRTCRPVSTPAPFRRSAPGQQVHLVNPAWSRWSSPSRAHGVSIRTARPKSRPSRCSPQRSAFPTGPGVVGSA